MGKTFKPCHKIQKPGLRDKTGEILWKEKAKVNHHNVFAGKKPHMVGDSNRIIKLEPRQNTNFHLSGQRSGSLTTQSWERFMTGTFTLLQIIQCLGRTIGQYLPKL